MDLLDSWFESIRNGNLKEIISIYNNNPDLINKFTTMNDGRSNYQTNAIIEASFQGNRDLVKWLIDKNADVNSTSDGGWRPIHFAAQHGHVTTVNLLVLGGAEVNAQTEAKETAIYFALQAYMRDTVKKLLHLGASLIGIDRDYLQMCIKKDILDPSLLDEPNKAYLSADSNSYRKIDSNGYDIIGRQHQISIDREIDEIKPIKFIKTKTVTEYDIELRRRRQDLLKKMRRTSTEPFSAIVTLIRRLAQTDSDTDKVSLVKEMLALVNNSQDIAVPQTKLSDQMITALELCVCDSSSSDQFIELAGHLIMSILHFNPRRGDAAVVDFWCRIFQKMTNLQIEQYSLQILKLLRSMIDSSSESVISNLHSNRDQFLNGFEFFFENLCYPKCLNLSLLILKSVYEHCADSVATRFHNVIDIMIGWCIHSDTDDPRTRGELCARSRDLRQCWINDTGNLRKTISNLHKDVLSHCQTLSRLYRIDKDRSQIDECKTKIKFFCFALSCVTSGISRIDSESIVDFDAPFTELIDNEDQNNIYILSNTFIISVIDKLSEALVSCSKQIDFDNLLLYSNTVILHLLSILNPNDSIGHVYQNVFRYIVGTCIPLQSVLSDNNNSNNNNNNNSNNNITNSINNVTNYHNRELIISFFNLIGICLTKISLDSAIIIQILSPLNWIHSCVFYRSSIDNQLLNRYLKLVDVIIRSPLVTTFYQILLSDLELALNTLIDSCQTVNHSINLIRLVQSNAFKAKSYEPHQAELVVKYNINMIRMLQNRLLSIKSSTNDHQRAPITLVPDVPVLFAKYLLFIDPAVVEKYPSLSQFIMEKVFDCIKSVAEPSDIIWNDLLKFLCLVFKLPNIDSSIRQKAFFIFRKINETLKFTNNRSINREMVNLIIDSLSHLIEFDFEFESIVLYSLQLIIDLMEIVELDKVNGNRLMELSVSFSQHNLYTIRNISIKLYLNLLSKIDNYFSVSTKNLLDKEIKFIQSITKSGRSFKFPMEFSKSIFNWIIELSDESSFCSSDIIRLEDLLTTSTRKSLSMQPNRLMMVYRIISYSCWDCIRYKLRFDPSIADSRLTLIAIENMVKSILTSGNSLKSVNDRRFRKLMSKFSMKHPFDQSLSVSLMILFLDLLEKLCYNSYEGCSIGFPSVNKSTETFFVANRQVCVDWFAKMRLPIIALAQYSGQWSSVVWHGLQLLHTYIDQSSISVIPEIEDSIVLTAVAFSKLSSVDSLVGLSRLAVDKFGHKFDWIDALVDKSLGRLEMAVEKFENYIRINHDPDRFSPTSSSTSTAVSTTEMRLLTRKSTSHSSFILCMEEIADCHKLLSNVDQLESWKKQIQDWKSNSQVVEAQKSSINWNRLIYLTKLSQWNANDDDSNNVTLINDKRSLISNLKHNTTYGSDLSWKYRSVIDYCEDYLFLSAIEDKSLSEIQSFTAKLASIQSINDFPNEFSNPDLILINERMKILEKSSALEGVTHNFSNLSRFSSTLPLSIIGFSNLTRQLTTDADGQGCKYSAPNFSDQRFLIKWHRKHENFTKCHSLIDQSFSLFLNHNDYKSKSQSIPLLSSCSSPVIQMQLVRQLVKLQWQQQQIVPALELLTDSLKENLMFETSDPAVHLDKCQLNTKSLLDLFSWLGQHKSAFGRLCSSSNRLSTNLQFLIDLTEVPWINGLPLVSPQHRSSNRSCQSSVTDVCSQLLILLNRSRNQDDVTGNDKSFIALAHWSLTRSRALDQSGFTLNLSDPRLIELGLSTDTLTNIELLLKSNFCPAQMQTEQDWLGDCYEDSTFLHELRCSILALDPDIDQTAADQIMAMWSEFLNQHFALHIAATDAYFSFLKDANYPEKSTLNRSQSLSTDRNRLTANLRILSLLGKRSRLLRTAIVNKIKSSPPGAWINVVPQLFARLKHSDQSIRLCMVDLVQRLALVNNTRWTNLIIYPTLVGSINEVDSNTPANVAYQEIKRVLVDNNRQLVDEVSLFIREMRRITVLWDELWVSALGQCYDELNKKANQLQSEIDKIDGQETLKHKDVILKLKYNSIIQPAIFILERTQIVTNVAPETPRECWFHNIFSTEISNTIEEIKSPGDIRKFTESWRKIKELQEAILLETNNNIKVKAKRNRHQFLSLKLDEVSPSLAKINTSLIPLPGINDKELVSIDIHISILPTKTKPKKFRFLSSDGQKYSYLYKGLEDLRLDERVMQILGIANTMFSKINERESNKYHVTTYSVTPLGTRAGLIQMVEEATSLFSLYKRHQMRNKSTFDFHKSRIRQSNNMDTNEATIASEEGHPIRPTDIYWQKLRPKLEAAKVDISFDNRDKWPLAILIEVLTELNKETPKDLLSKELWCCSINASNWFKSSINFTRSCAVMSIMGHMLGLGDRHLDNLLVNFSTGQMIHIDYNVCFDKGVSLKVPEKVPFRLTDIITYVFGPMVVDGVFKISCENVYEIINQSQDSILTLMDTFIFDPIVDWSSGIECGHYGSFEGGKFAINSNKSIIEKRSVEFLINLNNFQSVLITIEDELTNCSEKLCIEFNILHDNLYKSWSICDNIKQMRVSYNKKQEMIQYLKHYENENQPHNIIDHYHYIRLLKERSSNLEIDVKKRLKQMKQATIEHSQFFNKILSTSEFIGLNLEIKNIMPFFKEHISNIKKSTQLFLEQSSEGKEYDSIITDLDFVNDSINDVKDCFLVVDKYRNIIQEMPPSYFNNDRCSLMLQITMRLDNNPSLSTFRENMELYSNWIKNNHDYSITEEQFNLEKNNWNSILTSETNDAVEAQSKIVSQSTEDEIKELEYIWQLTMYENMPGINLFKAVLLEQYLEMANIAAHFDTTILNKVPESISLNTDYSATLRKYIPLLHAHENYFKILTNLMNVFGLYVVYVNESDMMCSIMSMLLKACVNICSFESKFLDIIMPEAIKIIKQLSSDDLELLDELKSIMKDGENILLHFNIAFTSATYDIKNYENIHWKTVEPIKEKIEKLTDINSHSFLHNSKPLRILIASFYTTINETYKLICDFIDRFCSSSSPNSWNFIDLVATSTSHISPIWNKSILLLKDALYISGLNCMINCLENCQLASESMSRETDPLVINGLFNNVLRNIEVYFHFITRHIITGTGSQCFGKMYCLLLEQAGWNVDAFLTENVTNSEYICASVVTFRKTEYPNTSFYTQLQYRFNNYKSMTGILTESNLSQKFLYRNLSFHKSLSNLAKNQLYSLCWSKRHLLTDELEKSDVNLNAIFDLVKIVDSIPNLLGKLKAILSNLDSVNEKFQSIDEKVVRSNQDSVLTNEICNKLIMERNQSINSLKKRILLVNEVMMNIDRFECLRSKSERATKFDEEAVQFLSDSEDLLTKLSQCDGLIKPIEEEIIKLKSERCIADDGDWWIELLNILDSDVNRELSEILEKEKIMKEMTESYEKDSKILKERLSIDYYPSMNHLKPLLRMLHNITKKLKTYMTLDESKQSCSTPDFSSDRLRTRVDRVLKLIGLIERFNSLIDGVMKFLSTTEFSTADEISSFTDKLSGQLANIDSLKDSVAPDLFSTLLSLSPLRIDDDKSELAAIVDIDQQQSKYGFSNNNMAETNGDIMTRISPSLSGGDEACVENKSNYRTAVVSATKTSAITTTVIDTESNKVNRTNSNTAGIQKAIEVWKLIESRLNPICRQHTPEIDVTTLPVTNTTNKSGQITQYIDKLIKAARSADNLARMYEGWTAWV